MQHASTTSIVQNMCYTQTVLWNDHTLRGKCVTWVQKGRNSSSSVPKIRQAFLYMSEIKFRRVRVKKKFPSDLLL